ncbi:hypothetical protein ACS3UN_12330 [Oscillospiraceae bacterium LTW-04]|nr:hypothetical protein RBH76_14075 [Oscillospiraceae bacterium MB24-C1]WMJ83872.1 hypothetical protein RBH76_00130 [Oscillospiraceae bacterium MB24-C1]
MKNVDLSKLQQLEARRDKLAAKWHESHEELRLWASAELYMRELLGLPHPE